MPTGTPHTVTAFDDDMKTIRGLVSEMGSRGEAAVSDAMMALADHDTALASRVMAADRLIDELDREVERHVVRTIALRAPMADDLRELVAALKMAVVLERVGDYAKNIAKRVPLIRNTALAGADDTLARMGAIATEMVRTVVEAHARRDVDLARAVCRRDSDLDLIYRTLFADLVAHIAREPAAAEDIAHLLFVSKNLERVGDHATSCAEMVYYSVTGETMPDGDRD